MATEADIRMNIG